MQRLPHRIRRQQWLVNAPSQEAAMHLRQQLRTGLETALQTVFERAFDALDVGDDVVRIPRLTLNLAVRPGADLCTVLAQSLQEQLDVILHEVVISRPEQAGTVRLTAPVQRRHLLLHYLASGHLDWQAGEGDDGDPLNEMQVEAAVLLDERRPLSEIVRGSLAQRIATSFRLLQLLAAGQRQSLLANAPLYTSASLPPALPATAHAVAALLPVLLQQCIASGLLSTPLQLRVKALLLALRPDELGYPLAPQILAIIKACRDDLLPFSYTDRILYAALRVLTTLRPDTTSALFDTWLPGRTDSSVSRAAKEEDKPPFISASFPDATEGLLARDAGLVLLHPFLTRFFETVGIAPAGAKALPEPILPRAAALLHWLMSGREEVFEWELTTIKVLLGCSPEQSVLVTSGLLSQEDRNEAERLLDAAITHWSALGKTTVTGLRMSFLQRQGMLRDIGRGWQLRVEPLSFDMLLGNLPWGIGIVKLPWMTRPIFTEWPTA